MFWITPQPLLRHLSASPRFLHAFYTNFMISNSFELPYPLLQLFSIAKLFYSVSEPVGARVTSSGDYQEHLNAMENSLSKIPLETTSLSTTNWKTLRSMFGSYEIVTIRKEPGSPSNVAWTTVISPLYRFPSLFNIASQEAPHMCMHLDDIILWIE